MTSAAVGVSAPFGSVRTRLRDPLLVGVFLGAFIGLVVMAVVAVKLRESTPQALCTLEHPCGPPPGLPRLVDGTLWRSTDLGYELEYDPAEWTVEREDARGLTLRSGSTSLRIDGERSTGAQALLGRRLDELRAQMPDLAANVPERTLLGPNVGYKDGVGGAYCGTPKGSTGSRVDVIAMAATDGAVAAAVTVLSDYCDKDAADSHALANADAVMNTFRWPTELGQVSQVSSRSRPRGSAASTLARRTPPDQRLGPTPASDELAFSLVLRLPRKRLLERELVGASDPRSPAFQRFLPAAGFGRRYGLPSARIKRLRGQLARYGIRVRASYPQRTALDVSASAAAVSRVFSVSLADFRERGSGRRYHLPLSRPRIPPTLADAVDAVSGLSSRPIMQPAAVPAGSLKPVDAAKAYDITPLWNMGVRGDGQTIAIVSWGSFADSDVAKFDAATGITGAPAVEHVPVEGGTDDVSSEVSGEVALDVETVRAIAPHAKILNYEIPYRGDTWNADVGKILNRIVTDGRAQIATMSYGICDVPTLNGSPWLSQGDRMNADRALMAAARAGMNVFIISHDQGAYTCQRFDPNDLRLSTAWPGGSRWAISVGGTLLFVRTDGSYYDEAGWEDVMDTWGSGVNNAYSNGKRQIPDVSASGDDGSPFFVVWKGEPTAMAGTSASSPFWAGAMALIREYVERQGGGKLGYANPIFYELTGTKQPYPPFHDVVRGGNRYYDATPGWDYATGLGSPDVFNLARDIVEYAKAHR
jgi:hypothetical protein